MPGLVLPQNAQTVDVPDDINQRTDFPFAVPEENGTIQNYVAIRKPGANGAVVAKFYKSGKPRFPKELYDIDSLIATYPGSANALDNLDVDETAFLTDEEIAVLEKAMYPARRIFG